MFRQGEYDHRRRTFVSLVAAIAVVGVGLFLYDLYRTLKDVNEPPPTAARSKRLQKLLDDVGLKITVRRLIYLNVDCVGYIFVGTVNETSKGLAPSDHVGQWSLKEIEGMGGGVSGRESTHRTNSLGLSSTTEAKPTKDSLASTANGRRLAEA